MLRYIMENYKVRFWNKVGKIRLVWRAIIARENRRSLLVITSGALIGMMLGGAIGYHFWRMLLETTVAVYGSNLFDIIGRCFGSGAAGLVQFCIKYCYFMATTCCGMVLVGNLVNWCYCKLTRGCPIVWPADV